MTPTDRVCRFCGDQWQGYDVVCQREPDGGGDPGRWGGKTRCCNRWIRERPDEVPGGPDRPPEYAIVTRYERAWLDHYNLTGVA